MRHAAEERVTGPPTRVNLKRTRLLALVCVGAQQRSQPFREREASYLGGRADLISMLVASKQYRLGGKLPLLVRREETSGGRGDAKDFFALRGVELKR